MNTQYEIIKSRPIAEMVVKKLKLHEQSLSKETPFEQKSRQAKELIRSSIDSALSLFPGIYQQQKKSVTNSSVSVSDENMEIAITRV